jgi:tRNA1Val (adenine37-N6)-methyltransferase
MANPYFKFKQFNIQQDRTAMKVCTDSCILGAWTAIRLQGASRILDIGAGTGLLPLMLAQKSLSAIDTIESDPESAAQAAENIMQSPWKDRIQLITGDVLYYSFPAPYDVIISNPPFYESDLHSPEKKKNIAKHDESLTLDKLLTIVRINLLAGGIFSILLPFHRTDYFEALAKTNGFNLQEKLTLRQTPKHVPFRSICLFRNLNSSRVILNELIIKNTEGKNSPEFAELMKDYYG